MSKIDELFPILQPRTPTDTRSRTYSETLDDRVVQRDHTLKQVAEWLSKRGPIVGAPGPLWAVGFSAALNMVTENIESLLKEFHTWHVEPEAEPATDKGD